MTKQEGSSVQIVHGNSVARKDIILGETNIVLFSQPEPQLLILSSPSSLKIPLVDFYLTLPSETLMIGLKLRLMVITELRIRSFQRFMKNLRIASS